MVYTFNKKEQAPGCLQHIFEEEGDAVLRSRSPERKAVVASGSAQKPKRGIPPRADIAQRGDDVQKRAYELAMSIIKRVAEGQLKGTHLLPSQLDGVQREDLHKRCSSMGLKHKSDGPPEHRVMKVWRPDDPISTEIGPPPSLSLIHI